VNKNALIRGTSMFCLILINSVLCFRYLEDADNSSSDDSSDGGEAQEAKEKRRPASTDSDEDILERGSDEEDGDK
jgi:hypothetical protein